MAHKIVDKNFAVDVIHFDSGGYMRYSIFCHRCEKFHCFYESELGLFVSDYRVNKHGLKMVCDIGGDDYG